MLGVHIPWQCNSRNVCLEYIYPGSTAAEILHHGVVLQHAQAGSSTTLKTHNNVFALTLFHRSTRPPKKQRTRFFSSGVLRLTLGAKPVNLLSISRVTIPEKHPIWVAINRKHHTVRAPIGLNPLSTAVPFWGAIYSNSKQFVLKTGLRS